MNSIFTITPFLVSILCFLQASYAESTDEIAVFTSTPKVKIDNTSISFNTTLRISSTKPRIRSGRPLSIPNRINLFTMEKVKAGRLPPTNGTAHSIEETQTKDVMTVITRPVVDLSTDQSRLNVTEVAIVISGRRGRNGRGRSWRQRFASQQLVSNCNIALCVNQEGLYFMSGKSTK